MLTSTNTVQPPNPHSDNQILPGKVASHLNSSWDSKYPGYQNLKIKRGPKKPNRAQPTWKTGFNVRVCQTGEIRRRRECDGRGKTRYLEQLQSSDQPDRAGGNSLQHTHKLQHTRATEWPKWWHLCSPKFWSHRQPALTRTINSRIWSLLFAIKRI